MAEATTALERHTRTLYEMLVSLEKPDPTFSDTVVVKARMVQLHKELGIPQTYYARIRSILFDGADPCVIQLVRGARGNPSVLCLRHPPPNEVFLDKTLTTRRDAATLYSDAADRLQRLEAWQAGMTAQGALNIVEALRDHEVRLARVEARVAEMTARVQGETNGKTAQDTGSG